MNIEKVLRVGARIEVRRKGTRSFHVAKVEDVRSNEFAISALFSGPEGELLSLGDRVECSVSETDGQGVVGFESTVLRRERVPVPVYYLSQPEDLEKVQRRGFVRAPVLLGVDYQRAADRTWHKGYFLDISGGGVKLSHTGKLDRDEVIYLAFSLNTREKKLTLKGRVIRSIPVETAAGTVYHSGVEFVDIPMSVQDRVVAYVFERLLEIRRSGGGTR